jgi:hypothetical protein
LITPSILETKIVKLFNLLKTIKKNKILAKTFQHNNYLGSYQSLFIYQKNKLAEAKFPPYAPYYWKKANNSYRDI